VIREVTEFIATVSVQCSACVVISISNSTVDPRTLSSYIVFNYTRCTIDHRME
jgi:hypothetical protein